MSFKKTSKILTTSLIILLLSTVVVSAKTQGFTSGGTKFFPNHIVDQTTGIPGFAASASTTYVNSNLNAVQYIEAKVSKSTKNLVATGSARKSVETGKLLFGPNTGRYVVYSFHDVDLGHSRSYFNDQRIYN